MRKQRKPKENKNKKSSLFSEEQPQGYRKVQKEKEESYKTLKDTANGWWIAGPKG